jgi:hypothetical protein
VSICENTERPLETCTLHLQDRDGMVAAYGGAKIHVSTTPDGLVSILVREYWERTLRKLDRDAVIEDLTARIEAAVAVLEAEPFAGAITQTLKILKGKL